MLFGEDERGGLSDSLCSGMVALRRIDALHHAFLLSSAYLLKSGELLLEIIKDLSDGKIKALESPDVYRVSGTLGAGLAEEVRAARDFAQKTSYSSECKFIIIDSVCELNATAANSLLKILEEPPKGTYFFLIYENKGKVMRTISSRCIRLTREYSAAEILNLPEDQKYAENELLLFYESGILKHKGELAKLIKDFNYKNFKVFYKGVSVYKNFKNFIFFELEGFFLDLFKGNVGAVSKIENVYFDFLIIKKYTIVYNMNFELVLYRLIYLICTKAQV